MKASEKQKTSIVKSFKGAQDTDNRNANESETAAQIKKETINL